MVIDGPETSFTVTTLLVTLFPFPSVTIHRIFHPLYVLLIVLVSDAVVSLKSAQLLSPGFCACHLYFSPVPSASTFSVNCLPFAAFTDWGCLVISGPAVSFTVAASLVMLFPFSSVTIQRIFHPSYILLIVLVRLGVVSLKSVHAPESFFCACHLYFKFVPSASTFSVNCFPVAAFTDSGCLVITT